MVEERDLGVYEPLPHAALQDVARSMDRVTERRGDEELQWLALTVARYKTGERSVAILRPAGMSIGEDLKVFHGSHEIEWSNGPEVVAVLLREEGDILRLEWTASSVNVTVEDLA